MRIDHIELFVPSREQAAEWYGQVFGFQILEEHRDWAVEGGPLMISNDGAKTMIALFKGPPQGQQEVRGFIRLAFRVTDSDFLRFMESSGTWRSTPLGPEDIQDHEKAISVYFSDPFGNLLEVTTYEHTRVRNQLL
ncbi:MAG: VOC family protein [Chloroflexi bacterium]|nr:VOC family protein [Chloroflexota bacterium]